MTTPTQREARRLSQLLDIPASQIEESLDRLVAKGLIREITTENESSDFVVKSLVEVEKK